MESPKNTITELLKNTSKEIDIAHFAKDKFNCECPRCGFLFNKVKQIEQNKQVT
ncbi:MAG: hypothetical protein FWG64_03200 [Firmicutes bacterium]|nr:hypothetical protein [Bacillota bacterium]